MMAIASSTRAIPPTLAAVVAKNGGGRKVPPPSLLAAMARKEGGQAADHEQQGQQTGSDHAQNHQGDRPGAGQLRPQGEPGPQRGHRCREPALPRDASREVSVRGAPAGGRGATSPAMTAGGGSAGGSKAAGDPSTRKQFHRDRRHTAGDASAGNSSIGMSDVHRSRLHRNHGSRRRCLNRSRLYRNLGNHRRHLIRNDVGHPRGGWRDGLRLGNVASAGAASLLWVSWMRRAFESPSSIPSVTEEPDGVRHRNQKFFALPRGTGRHRFAVPWPAL